MCGSAAPKVTATKSDLPNRHQIRNAIRKVARTMRKDNLSMNEYDFTYKVLQSGGWTRTLVTADWLKAQESVKKAVMNSTFFSHLSGVCGGTKLALRKTAKL